MNTLSIIAILFYFAATIQRIITIQRTSEPNIVSKPFIVLSVAAVCIHAYVLFHSLDITGNLNLGFFNAISVTCWLVMTIILVTSLKKPLINICMLMMPVTAIAMLAAGLNPSQYKIDQDLGLALDLHISFSLIAYSLLSLAALQACLLAFQDRQIRNKHPSLIMKTLPPLQTMENLLIQITALGFFILSLSLVSGAMFIEDIVEQHLAHKIVLSVLAWFIFASLLFGRWSKGWRGQTLTRWTIGGFVLLLLAYLGSKFVLELILERV